MSVVFTNPGLIDLTAATTLGVNVKEGANAIGQFGTGLKCAIAVILRLGGSITIYRGKKAHLFNVKTKTVRGKQFRIVCMNGRELGFTDQYAGHWLPWMAYRELWSNCRDEGGTVFESLETDLTVGPGRTVIVVDSKDLKAAHDERHKIVLQTSALISLPDVDVHAGETERVYYKGIRVADVPSKRKSLYTYCLTGYQTLTEDRTLAYQWMLGGTIVAALVQSTNRAVITDVLTADKDYWEHYLPWEEGRTQKPSPQFMETAEALKADGKLRGSALQLFKSFLDTVPGYHSPFNVVPSEVQEQTVVQAALELLSEIGVHIRREVIQFKSDRGSRGVDREGEFITVPEEELKADATELAVTLLIFYEKDSGGGVRALAYRALTGDWPAKAIKRAYDPYAAAPQEMSF